MNGTARDTLQEIIQHYGREICHDPRRCEALLRDLCANQKREIFLLVSALRAQAVADLLSAVAYVPYAAAAARVTSRLQNDLGLSEEAAVWTVETWAWALGLSGNGSNGTHAAHVDWETAAEEARPQGLLSDLLTGLLGQPMVFVPAGPFLMGSSREDDPKSLPREHPQHTVSLADFWVGRDPVTRQQFREYVTATQQTPLDSRMWNGPNDHPINFVSWYEAVGYCAWLSERSRMQVALPSEAEWEKAARGTDGRLYPWGNQSPHAGLCHAQRANGHTSAVGRHSPAGDSPYGCTDMVGNVWEWTRSLWGRLCHEPAYTYPYHPDDGREIISNSRSVMRVIRGGVFGSSEWAVTCAHRDWCDPLFTDGSIGFRVVVHV